MDAPLSPPARPSLLQATQVWARIGLLGFGGPAGQIALMHRMLVEERRWIGERRFLHALNYCMLLPGPEAQQLAIYIGWLMHRTLGGVIAGLLFVLPGALIMLGLSIGYVLWGAQPAAVGLFLGVKAAVLALVVEAVLRVGRRALKSRLHRCVAAAAFLGIWGLQLPFPLVILAAGLVGWFAGQSRPGAAGGAEAAADAEIEADAVVDAMFARGELGHTEPGKGRALKVLAVWLPVWLSPVAALFLFTGPSLWTQLAAFFSTMGVVTFGGAYAVLAYVAQAAVETFGWLRPGEMGDGLGLAETTPGPLILVLQFVGFVAAHRQPGGLDPLMAGALGALLTTWVTFAPCFLWIFLGGPYVEQLRGHRGLAAALGAVTAAVVGVIFNLAVWFALHTLFRQSLQPAFGPDLPVLASIDWRSALLAIAAMILLLRLRLGAPMTLAVCAAGGLILGTLTA